MKIASFLSVCTLALATAVAADHGKYEHNSMAPAFSESPGNKPAHHWAARKARDHEHEHSAYTGDSDEKASHNHDSREAREPHRVHHSREAGRHEYTHEAPASQPTHHYLAAHEAREHEHEGVYHGGMKPTPTHHYARDAGKPISRPSHSNSIDGKKDESTKKPAGSEVEYDQHYTRDADRKGEHEQKHTEEMKNHPHTRDADHKPKHGDSKPEGHPHYARDADRKPKHEPMHTGGAVAGKPGHHFIRSAARPTGRPNFGSGSGNFANNPFMGTRFTPGSAITSVRGILTGQSGINHICDRCVAAMQVGQRLAQQVSTADFSKAVVGLCKQVGYKSNSGCSDAFSVGKVGPYVSTLQNADLRSDGKGFCKQYFGTC